MKKITIAEFIQNKPFGKVKEKWASDGFTKKPKKPKREFIENMQNPILCKYHTINVKPFSKKKMYQRHGATNLTKEFIEFKNDVTKKLPKLSKNEENYLYSQKFCFYIHFYVKEQNANVNNLLYPFQIVLDQFYNFNERAIFKTVITKNVGNCEYIRFKIARMRGRKIDGPYKNVVNNDSYLLFD